MIRGVLAIMVLVAITGCKSKNEDRSHVGGQPAPAEVKAFFNAVAKGMKTVSVDRLSEAMLGKRCVVMAATAKGYVPPPPPPPGMMRIMGPTTIYRATLAEVTPDALILEEAYPTSGKSKRIEVARLDVEAFAFVR